MRCPATKCQMVDPAGIPSRSQRSSTREVDKLVEKVAGTQIGFPLFGRECVVGSTPRTEQPYLDLPQFRIALTEPQLKPSRPYY